MSFRLGKELETLGYMELTDNWDCRLDISPSSIHLKRRIWQEAISTLLFTDPETRIPQGQTMAYAQARDSEYPPYLLNFTGSPGERHAENIKVLSFPPITRSSDYSYLIDFARDWHIRIC